MAIFTGSFLLDAAISVLIVIVAFIFYVKVTYQFWESQGIKQIPPSFPYGNTKNVFRTKQIGPFLANCYKYFRDQKEIIGGFYFCLRPELLLIDPEVIKTVLVKDFWKFSDRCLYTDEKIDPLTGNLVAMRGKNWHKMRKKLNPTFTVNKIKMMFPILQDTSTKLHQVLAECANTREVINISQVMCSYTSDIIGSYAFGIDCNSLQGDMHDLVKYFELVAEPQGINYLRYFFAYACPNLMKHLRIRVLTPVISKFFLNVVEDTVKYREENNIVRNDFLNLLMQLKNKGSLPGEAINNLEGIEDESLTIKEIAAQCFIFFGAGYETTAQTLSFCMYELAQNLEIQYKLREEILNVLEKYNGEVTYDAIMEMQYLDKILQETLRKYPIIPYLMRQCTKDYNIPDTTFLLRKGQVVNISVFGLHRDPEYYPDPEKFDPERFNEEMKSKRVPYTYLPFGDGPRICIGAKLTQTEVKMAIVIVLRNYKITVNEKTKTPLQMSPKRLFLAPLGGIWLNISCAVP